MHRCRGWEAAVPLILLVVLVGCGTTRPEAVHVGASQTTAVVTSEPPASTTSTTLTTRARATSTTVLAPDPGPSPVEGITAAELRAVVEVPIPAGKRASSDPVAQPVRLPNDTTVWRVRIPGRFPVRSARVAISVGGHRIGEGVVGPRLRSLVAATRDRRALVPGAVVTIEWEGSDPVTVGRLVVVR